MKEVICKFCERKCRWDLGLMGNVGYWRCDYHGGVVVKYNFSKDSNNPYYTIIMVYQTETMYYQANFFYDNPNFPYKFRLDNMKRGYLGKLDAEEIFTLDFHPDITPDNLPNKITKYVIFS